MSLLAANLDLVMFAALCGGILLGYPVVFTLSGIAILFGVLGLALGHFNMNLLAALGQRVFSLMTNEILLAIPLFVLMGVILERSRIAEELLEEMGRLFGGVRGGLAVSVILVGMLLAASTGIVGATVVTMALIAMPAMLRHGYGKPLASGVIVSAGTLGQIIPPSTMLIILAEVMSSGYQQAQFAMGKFTIETISVGDVFAAALIPGLCLVAIYIAFVLGLALLRPKAAPAIPRAEDLTTGEVLRHLGRVLVPPIVLIVAVLGSILGGIATPTEAAAVGAVGALMLAGPRLMPGRSWLPFALSAAAIVAMLGLTAFVDLRTGRSEVSAVEQAGIWVAAGLTVVTFWGILVALWRAHRVGVLRPVLASTTLVTSMIFAMMIGASVFSLVFRGLGGDARVEEFLTAMPGGETGALLFVMAVVFVLGFFLDFVEISVIVLPIVVPVLLAMGMDPIWLAVLIAINLQTSFLTPPFGFSLFYLRGAAPPEVRTIDIYRGVVPFVLLQIVGMLVIYWLPDIATWLPRLLAR
ncbi:TRAP transporter large permease [Caenispirillum bisanense]|uniref:TRAP transporter, DctM subunit n=1 Tax=Caenispirillum bisanense TaxID=414052 RepID=A0A286H037_9PROT|nr:TRAP transporter large permease subunit [Caenispirillum bisanense]SOE00816.1 TRAP transporter, DctM subunit [Caenispirillum bisanense]